LNHCHYMILNSVSGIAGEYHYVASLKITPGE
jgi:hypothetical protein